MNLQRPQYRRQLVLAMCLSGSVAYTGTAYGASPANIVMLTHGAATNPFWQAVKKGFDDACARTQSQCQMVFTQTDGSIEQQSANAAAEDPARRTQA